MLRSVPVAPTSRYLLPACTKLSRANILSLQRYIHNTPNAKSITTSPPSQNQPFSSQLSSQNTHTTKTTLDHKSRPISTNSTEYLASFNTKELISFFVIGLCTLNKLTLNTCIKLFPYTPLKVIEALVYRIYCGGANPKQVRETAQRLHEQRGINNIMLSLTIEACEGNDNIDPEFIVDETIVSIKEVIVPHTVNMIKTAGKDINDIPSGYVALKPTGFVKDAAHVLKNYNNGQEAAFADLVAKATRACQAVYDANQELAKQYPERTAPFVVAVIDAEKHDLQPGVYELQRQLYKKFNKLNEPVNIVGTLQMYLSESADLLAEEERLAKEHNYRLGLKLVRGAYIHSEKNRATVIHKTKEDTDNNYNSGITYCIDSILESKGNESTIGHLVVASHNAESLKLASSKVYTEANKTNKNKCNVVLGQLLGMADTITYDLIENHKIGNVIKYVPWGPPLETKEYLLRRLEENGDAVKSDNGWPLVKATFAQLMNRLVGKSA